MKTPVLFMAHGSPMNALYNNQFTQMLHKLGSSLEKPKAILMISAHWLSRGKTYVHNKDNPKIIYDFGGFPQSLYDVQYSVKGSSELAQMIVEQVSVPVIESTEEWGIDHGAWTILKHMFPDTDVPVVQLSIDFSQSSEFHFQLGEALSFLREKNILIIASGNLIHNLRTVDFHSKKTDPTYTWVKKLDDAIVSSLESKDYNQLMNYYSLPYANMGINNPDHYLPFLYALGAGHNGVVSYPYEGYELGTLDMRCVRFD